MNLLYSLSRKTHQNALGQGGQQMKCILPYRTPEGVTQLPNHEHAIVVSFEELRHGVLKLKQACTLKHNTLGCDSLNCFLQFCH
jgi:hypothetical protein